MLYLVQPPLIGLDARNIRLSAEGARVPVVVVSDAKSRTHVVVFGYRYCNTGIHR